MRYESKTLTLEEKIGQLFFASIDGLTLDQAAVDFLRDNHIGNVVLFGNNTRDRAQVMALNATLRERIPEWAGGVPPLVGIDHEGGNVVRFREGATRFPPPMAVGATGDVALASLVGHAMGRELRSLGISVNFAPTLDVNTNPLNPVIGLRAFGDDPAHVAAFGMAVAAGMQAEGLIACGKHFPGHGDTATDSHFSLPVVDRDLDSLRQAELFPFAEAVRRGIEAVMTSHILFPQVDPDGWPATMSRRILMDILRGELGFDGLIISDGMQMQAVAKGLGIEESSIAAVRAGCDMLCIGTGGAGTTALQARCYRAVLDAARSGDLPLSRIDDAVRRILAAKARHAVAFSGEVNWTENQALALRVARESVTYLTSKRVTPQGRILCASTMVAESRYGITEANWQANSFAVIASERLGGEAAFLGKYTDYDLLDDFDTVVVGVSRADEMELEFLRKALQRGKRTVAVLMGLPYLVKLLPPGCSALCAFGTAQVSVQAACDILSGEAQARGTLPVRL